MSETAQTPETQVSDSIKKEFAFQPISVENSFINHKDIAKIVISGAPAREKLELLNSRLPEGKKLQSMKGVNKPVMIEIAKALLDTSSKLNVGVQGKSLDNPGDQFIIAFKKEAEALRSKYEHVLLERNSRKAFKEPKHTTEEYLQFVSENRESIVNGEKNRDSISPALFNLGVLENKPAVIQTLIEAAIPPELLTKFMQTNNILEYTPETQELKSEIIKNLNQNKDNVQKFKERTGLTPTMSVEDWNKKIGKNNDQKQEQSNVNQIKR
ncbi:hypothetical protein ACQ1Q5_00075 [Ornithobacterium rhinotracheale]